MKQSPAGWIQHLAFLGPLRHRRSVLWGAALLVATSIGVSPPARAQGVNLSNLPDHPRFFLRESLIPTLRAERTGRKAGMWEELVRRANGFVGSGVTGLSYKIGCLAIVGIVENDTRYTDQAIQELLYRASQGWSWQDGDRYLFFYDWLYNYMTDAQRAQVRTAIRDVYFNVGDQRTVYYNLEGNEAMSEGLAGLAIYGDGGGSSFDSWAQERVDECDGRMRGVREYTYPGGSANSRGGVLPTRQYYFPDGGYYKGGHYGQKDLEAVVRYLYVFKDLGIGDHWNMVDTYIDGIPEYFLRIMRPDYTFARMAHLASLSFGVRAFETFAILASERSDGLAAWVMDRPDWAPYGSGGYEWYLVYVLWRPNLPKVEPATLPLYKFYGTNGIVNGQGGSWYERVSIRTGWTFDTAASDDVYFHMHAGKFFGDYFSYDQLGFEIYYRGALAIKAGEYDGADRPNQHGREYNSNNASTNTVVVIDPEARYPNELYGSDRLYSDDSGGPGRPVHIYDIADGNVYDQSDFDKFGVLSDAAPGQEWYYLRALVNPSSAYTYTNADRQLQVFDREVFVLGHNFVFRDSVKVGNPSNSVRWLLHTIQEPQMSGSLISATAPGHIERYARGEYSATRTWENYNGKITVRPLLPANAVLRKVGGAGYECWVDDGEGNGANYGPVVHGDCPACYVEEWEIGQWRVETIAPSSSVVNFVHHIWVGTPGQSAPRSVAVDDEGMIGSDIEGVGVFMFRNGARGPDGYSYQTVFGAIPSPIDPSPTGPSIIHTIADLEPYVAYLVRFDDGEGRMVSADGNGLVSFRAPGPVRVTISEAPLAQKVE